MSRVAKTPFPIVAVNFTMYDLTFPGALGTGCGYPGALRILFFVSPRTSHSLCPSGSQGCPTTRAGMVRISTSFALPVRRNSAAAIGSRLLPVGSASRVGSHELSDYIYV